MNLPLLLDAKATKQAGSYRPRVPVNYAGTPNKRHVARIMEVWASIDDNERQFNRAWYWRCRTWCENMAVKYDTPVERVAAILAALSPSCSYERNLLDTEHILKLWANRGHDPNHRCVTYKRNVVKAEAIANGAPIASTLAPKPKRSGMKVLAFYRAIVQPWRPDSIVIDRHAAAIAYGDKYPKGITYRRYKDFQADYFTAARKLGIGCNEIQAATWCAWRKRGL